MKTAHYFSSQVE